MAASEASFTLLIWLNEIVPFYSQYLTAMRREMGERLKLIVETQEQHFGGATLKLV